MAERELLLHIGTHKTGTTSFQQLMRRNEARLLKVGVFPVSEPKLSPEHTGNPFNLRGFAHYFLRPELVTVPRVKGFVRSLSDPERRLYENAMVERVNASDAQKVIISAEGLCFFRKQEEQAALARFLSRIDRSSTAFVVFRDDEAWRKSWVRECQRYPEVTAALAALPDHRRIEGEWYFDKPAICAFWSEIVPLVQIDYDQFEDICPELATRMGVSMNGLVSVDRQNVTPAGG